MYSIRQLYRDFLNTEHGAAVYRRFKRILYSDADSLVAELSASVLPRLSVVRSGRVRLCDVGGGDGGRVTSIVEHLNAAFNNAYDVDFVEQSMIYAEDFAQRAKPPCLTARIHHGLFETVTLPAKAYDLVLLIHSIFAFANGAAVSKVLGLVGEGGNAVMVSNASDSFLAGLKRLADAGFDDMRYEVADLARSLDARGVPYSTHTFETQWEIPESRLNQDVGDLCDWISLGRFATFDARAKRMIEAYIWDASTSTGSGRTFAEKEVVLVVPPLGPVPKQA